MIVVVKQTASMEQLNHLVDWIHGQGFKTHVSKGDNETIVGIIGDTSQIDPFLLESMSIIRRVQRVSEPFKKANRAFHPEDTVVDCGHGVRVGGGGFLIIASAYSMDSKELMDVSTQAKTAGASMLRGRAYQSRTSPYAYQGMGEKGLDLLKEIGTQLNMPVVAEVVDPRDVQTFVDKGIDVMQIGTHNAHNYSLLREVGKTATPVLLKRGRADTIDDLLMEAEYVMSEGNPNVILCESGIRTFETRMRSTFDVNAIPMLKHLSHLPVLGDPTHSTGYTRYACAATYAATAAGADGVEIELCPQDDADVSNNKALTPKQFVNAVQRIRLIHEALTTGLDEG